MYPMHLLSEVIWSSDLCIILYSVNIAFSDSLRFMAHLMNQFQKYIHWKIRYDHHVFISIYLLSYFYVFNFKTSL